MKPNGVHPLPEQSSPDAPSERRKGEEGLRHF